MTLLDRTSYYSPHSLGANKDLICVQHLVQARTQSLIVKTLPLREQALMKTFILPRTIIRSILGWHPINRNKIRTATNTIFLQTNLDLIKMTRHVKTWSPHISTPHWGLGIYHISHLRVYGGQRMDWKFYPLVKGRQQKPTTAIWHNTVQNIQGGAVRLSAQRLNWLNPVLDFFPFLFTHRVIGTLFTWLLLQMGAQEGLVYVPVYSGAWFGCCITFCSLSAWGPKPACGYLRQNGNHLLMGAMLVLSADSSLVCL